MAIDVAAGEEHSLLLTNDLKVFAVGNNLKGNLGLGHNFSSDTFLYVHGGLDTLKIRSIEAGRHSSAISNDGRLIVWGPVFSDESNPLILPQELKSNKTMKAISIGCSLTAVVDQEGHLYTWGTSNRFG